MQKIIVKNFRQISTAEVEVKKILFFIGEQASGKSTLAKLIYFFKSLKEDYFNLIYENANSTEGKLEILFIKKIQDKFKVYFGYTSELDRDFEIIFYYNFVTENSPQNRYLKLNKANTLQVQFDDSYFREILNNTRELAKAISDFTLRQTKTTESNYIVIERTKTGFIKELTQRVNSLFYDPYTPMFFPAGRNITTSYPEQFQTLFLGNIFNSPKPIEDAAKSVDMLLMKSFILHSKFLYDYFRGNSFDLKISNHTNRQFINILQFFKNHSEYILKGRYDNTDGNEKIIYDDMNQKSVPLNIASSGQQESVRIIQDLFYLLCENQKSFRIIEEPEAHLYPKAQKKLIELLTLVANKTQSQFIITTHSPYILSILNNLLMYSVVVSNNIAATKSIEQHFGTGNLDTNADERLNILPDEIQAYAVNINADIYCHSIIDQETGMIGENYLDSITEELNSDFDVLYTLHFQN